MVLQDLMLGTDTADTPWDASPSSTGLNWSVREPRPNSPWPVGQVSLCFVKLDIACGVPNGRIKQFQGKDGYDMLPCTLCTPDFQPHGHSSKQT